MRKFRIDRFDDYDGSVHFTLVYPETFNPGDKMNEKRVSIASIGMTSDRYVEAIERTLEKAKAEFDGELTRTGALL